MELDPKDLEDMGLDLDTTPDTVSIWYTWIGIGVALGVIVLAVFLA